MLTQSGAPGCVIGLSNFLQSPTVVNILYWICRLLIFSILMCHFDSVVYLDVEPDNQDFD